MNTRKRKKWQKKHGTYINPKECWDLYRTIGTDILKHGLQNMAQIFGLPDHIEYIWNGLNQYVYDWLEKNFDAVCNCPLAVQKTQSDDDWSSHIYTLDKDKVLEFAGIEKEKDEREL